MFIIQTILLRVSEIHYKTCYNKAQLVPPLINQSTTIREYYEDQYKKMSYFRLF